MVSGFPSGESDTVVTEFSIDIELSHELLGPRERFVIGIQRWVNGGRARINSLRYVDQVLLLGRFVLLR